MSDGVRMLWVGNGQVGLVGLDEALDDAQKSGLSGEGLTNYLLENVKRRNYIPRASERAYAEALTREYRRFSGEEVEDPVPDVLRVEVLGAGCSECDRLEQEVRNILSELGISGMVERVKDPEEIRRYKIFGGPGLVINGRVRAAGKVPRRRELTDWLRGADSETTES